MEGAFELVDTYNTKVVIKIISMSNSSDDAVRNFEKHIDGVNFIYSDAIENTNIREILNGTDMVFLIGATNDSKLNEIAEITLELKILTIAVVTDFITLDTSKNITQLLCYVDEGKTLNNILCESVQNITNLLVHAGMINVDLEDIRIVLFGKSSAMISASSAISENRAIIATKQALASPLFHDVDLKTVSSVLVNISAENMGQCEFDGVGSVIHNNFSENVKIKIGMSINEDLGEVINVTVVVAV
jgi:cell division protein FtsZ